MVPHIIDLGAISESNDMHPTLMTLGLHVEAGEHGLVFVIMEDIIMN
jgi:hypothetical protein